MKFYKKILSNGMTVLFEERDLPVISFSITNKFGAMHESSEIKGIAHFIEHLVFTGTHKRSHEDISREIEKRGGVLNAFTTSAVTSYWFKLPSEHIDVGMEILIDILTRPSFNSAKFEKEKKVILEEIKLHHDNPIGCLHEQIFENLYDGAFGQGVLGSEKTIKGLTRDFVEEYFANHYDPSNYIISMVGKTDFDKVCNLLEKSFQRRKSLIKEPIIKKINKQTVEKRAGIDQAHYMFGIHSPLGDKDASYAFEVLDCYLANGMSSKLFLKIREERGLAYIIQSLIDSKKEYSYYTIYVGTSKESVKEVNDLIIEEFDNVKNITHKELEEAKERLIGLRKINAEESTNVMTELMFSELSTKAEDYYLYEEKINAVTLDEIKNLCKIKNYSSAVIIPNV